LAETIRGINVVISGDTTGLAKALSDVNQKSRDIQYELKQVEKLLKLDPSNTELVAQKQRLLSEAIANTNEKLSRLRAVQEQVNEQFAKGEIGEGQYRAFQRELAATEQQLKSLEKQLADTKKGFDFREVLDNASKALKDVGKQLTEVGKGLTTTFTAPITVAGASIMALAKKTADAGDELAKMAARTGFSVEALSEYKYAAELSGTSLDALETSIKKMQNTITDAANGNKTAARTLNDLGLSFNEIKNLSPETQFAMIATSIASIEDPTRRAALAQDVFGKSGTDLLPMLANGALGLAQLREEARQLGVVWTEDSAKAAEKFNDDLQRVQAAVGGAFKEVGEKLLPVLSEKLIPVIQEHVIPAIQRFAERIGDLIQWFANLDPKWQAVILAAVGLAAAIGPLLTLCGMFVSALGVLLSPIGLVTLAVTALIAAGIALAANWDTIKAKAAEIWGAIVSTLKNAANAMIGLINSIIGAAEKMVNALASAINRIPRFEIPSWVPGIGGKSFGLPDIPTITLPRIPLLDTGGLVRGPALVGVGPGITEAFVQRGSRGFIDYDRLAAAMARHMKPSVSLQTNIYSPEPLSPSAIKRKQEQALRQMALEWGIG